MSDAPNFVEYRPPADGVPPPNWRKGMAWGRYRPAEPHSYPPVWRKGARYQVPPEALTAPNEDASGDYPAQLTRLGQEYALSDALALLRRLPAETLAKHGITLSEPKDWATELWADLMDAWDHANGAAAVRAGNINNDHQAAIALIRERVVLKEGV